MTHLYYSSVVQSVYSIETLKSGNNADRAINTIDSTIHSIDLIIVNSVILIIIKIYDLSTWEPL